MLRRILVAVAGWLAVAAIAFTLVLAALGVSGTGMFNSTDQPLSEAAAASMLAALPSTTAAAPQPDGQQGAGTLVTTAYGTARLGCSGNTPVLEYVNPAPGYSYNMKPSIEVVPTLSILLGPAEIVAVCKAGRPDFYIQ